MHLDDRCPTTTYRVMIHQLQIAYGSTEMSPVVSFTQHELLQKRPESVGVAMDHIEVTLVLNTCERIRKKKTDFTIENKLLYTNFTCLSWSSMRLSFASFYGSGNGNFCAVQDFATFM